jgi:hypothetical protein
MGKERGRGLTCKEDETSISCEEGGLLFRDEKRRENEEKEERGIKGGSLWRGQR